MPIQTRQNKRLASLLQESHFNLVETNAVLQEDCLQDLPHNLKRLFQIAGDPGQSVRIRNDLWYLLSLKEVISRKQCALAANPAHDSLDIAIAYHGMGHWVVCAWNVTKNAFFYRLDGGSNGYDVLANQTFAHSNITFDEKCLFSIERWIHDIDHIMHAESLPNIVYPN